MKKQHYLIGLIVGLVFIVIGFFIAKNIDNPYIVLECPDTKEPIMILKDMSKAFPIYAASYSSNLETALKYLKNIEANMEGSIANNIVKLREDLTQESSRLESMLKTILLSLQSTPCDQNARKQFWSIVHNLNNKGQKILVLTSKLQQLEGEAYNSNINTRDDKRIEAIRFFIQDYSF